MRALQALVVFLGLLIVAGVGLLVVLLVQGPRHSVTQSETTAPPTAASLPQGYRVAEMASAGDHVVLRLEADDGRQELAILDPTSGLITHTVEIPFHAPGLKP